jgi:hypothetical protein
MDWRDIFLHILHSQTHANQIISRILTIAHVYFHIHNSSIYDQHDDPGQDHTRAVPLTFTHIKQNTSFKTHRRDEQDGSGIR